MYPDRAMFQRMVQDEPNLSGAGKETLLALYDGPLRLRQIMDILKAPESSVASGASKEKDISESALRKRLDILISRGIITRAGSERTNPYYCICRPWIFSQYILTKCRDRPRGGLLDLTILLHELSHMSAESDVTPLHPRYISAMGERTERSHQIGAAYKTFQKLLGNQGAIGEYLEGIYEDIYDGRVPESDIDGLIARDFLRFVATAPTEEREVRFFFWYADFFHILNRYQDAYDAFMMGVDLAGREGISLPPILADARIAKGDLLLSLNDPAGAKEAFLEISGNRETGPFTKAKSLFGAGEVELLCGDIRPPYASARFSQARDLCDKADAARVDPDVQELRADILRRTGTIHRVSGRLDEAEACYAEADAIYQGDSVRGMVWLLPERAELLRARAFSSPAPAAEGYLANAAALYEEGRAVSQRIRNINWYAHGLIGECELARVAYQKCNKPLPRDLDTKYANAFEIYCQISSHWGIVQTFISEALLYHTSAEAFPDRYAITADKLGQAEQFSRDLGLKTELALIQRIKSRRDPEPELHPLTFL